MSLRYTGLREAGAAILDAEKPAATASVSCPLRTRTSARSFRHLTSCSGSLTVAVRATFYLALGPRDSGEGALEKERARYLKKGWSEAKIS